MGVKVIIMVAKAAMERFMKLKKFVVDQLQGVIGRCSEVIVEDKALVILKGEVGHLKTPAEPLIQY